MIAWLRGLVYPLPADPFSDGRFYQALKRSGYEATARVGVVRSPVVRLVPRFGWVAP